MKWYARKKNGKWDKKETLRKRKRKGKERIGESRRAEVSISTLQKFPAVKADIVA